jgi:hypothetical protein
MIGRGVNMVRLVLALCLACLLAGCGGGDDSASPALSAAQVVASRTGQVAQAASIDAAVFTRKRALADAPTAVPARVVQLFNLGESNYSQYFPSRQGDRIVGGFFYRYYPETGAYLIVDEAERIYVLGGPFGSQVILVGQVGDYLQTCVAVATGFDVTLLDQPPIEVSPGGGGGSSGDGGGAGVGSAEGAIRAADVKLYDRTGGLIGTAVSDERGLARLQACGALGPFRIEYVGNDKAQYFDEGIAARDGSDANAWVPFPAGEVLSAWVENLTDHHVVVTVMTHVAAQQVQQDLQPGGASASRVHALGQGEAGRRESTVPVATVAAVRAANQKARDFINQRFAAAGIEIDDVTKIPALAFSLDSLRSFGSDRRGRYGQMLNALAKAAARFNPGLPNPAREMTKQLTADLSDGVLDGKDRGGVPVAPTQQRAYDPGQLTGTVVAQAAGRLVTDVVGAGSVSVTTSTAAAVPCGNGTGLCYPFGTVVALQATPAAGARLEGWSAPCAGTPPSSSCLVTMSGDKLVRATFSGAVPVRLQVSVLGAGGSVSSDPAGIACPGDCAEDFAAGTVVTLRANAAAGTSFSGWSGDCSGSGSCTLTMSAARNVSASFTADPVLSVTRLGSGAGTVTSTDTGINCGSACSRAYAPGTQVTLTAIPASGSVFAGWSGACSGLASCVVSMDQARAVGATFSLANFNLSVSVTGSGLVSSSPPGISACSAGPCTASYGAGTTVLLQPTPQPGATFIGWSGDCSGSGSCELSMSAARSVTANFTTALPPGTLTVTRLGNGSGTVASTDEFISCGSICSRVYPLNSQVTLVATPAAGSVFAGWSGACSGTGSCNVLMDSAKSVQATFNPAPPGAYRVGGTVSSDVICITLVGVQCGGAPAGLQLQMAAGINVLIQVPTEAKTFQFPLQLSNGIAYTVTVSTQPAGFTCRVDNGSGVINGANVTNVAVVCIGIG